jgi:VanZ family protein
MHKFNTVLREVSHAIEFFPMGVFCAWLCLLHLTLKKKYLISSLLSFLFVLLNAFADEIHQIFVPGRSFQMSDIFTDSVGGLVGIAAGLVIVFVITKIKSKKQKISA